MWKATYSSSAKPVWPWPHSLAGQHGMNSKSASGCALAIQPSTPYERGGHGRYGRRARETKEETGFKKNEEEEGEEYMKETWQTTGCLSRSPATMRGGGMGAGHGTLPNWDEGPTGPPPTRTEAAAVSANDVLKVAAPAVPLWLTLAPTNSSFDPGAAIGRDNSRNEAHRCCLVDHHRLPAIVHTQVDSS